MLKLLSFGLTALMTLLLIAGSIVEKIYGTDTAFSYIYTAPWTIALWGLLTVASLVYLLRRLSPRKTPATVGIHLSFALILIAALVSHCCGLQGTVQLVEGGKAVNGFLQKDNRVGHFPFHIQLQECYTEFYPGTQASMDYVSRVQITLPQGKPYTETISMNKILKVNNYRFYQTAIGPGSSTLTVSYDPWGIGLTYAGYAALALSLIAFFFQRGSRFRALLRSVTKPGAALLVAFFAFGLAAQAQTALPKTLQRGLAKSYGQLYVYYNDRVCPLQTLARDFCTKLYGKDTYHGLTAEQVLTGWIFYYDDWKREPMIKIKGDDMKQLLGIEGDYAALTDFYDTKGYKLSGAAADINNRRLQEANEKCNLVSLVCTGALIKIYPYHTANGNGLAWLSWVDKRPRQMPLEEWKFIVGSMEYVAREIQLGHNINANEALHKIKAHQRTIAGAENLPSDARFQAEVFYNNLPRTTIVAGITLVAGVFLLFLSCRSLVTARPVRRGLRQTFRFLTLLVWLYLSLMLVLRGYVSGHWPLSNGYETMQFMAWCALGVGLLLGRRFQLAVPFGFITCGLSLMVSTMGEQNPTITHLLPVLSSPLLSLHVVVIMLAYALLAFTMLGSLTALAANGARGVPQARREDIMTRLQRLNRLLLLPALFLLAAGIFIGAVWANQSWGRYWGWDPKETWALITMLVYAFPLHDASLAFFRRPKVFHWYVLCAFLSVLVTYFGVNFFMAGLHSYAV